MPNTLLGAILCRRDKPSHDGRSFGTPGYLKPILIEYSVIQFGRHDFGDIAFGQQDIGRIMESSSDSRAQATPGGTKLDRKNERVRAVEDKAERQPENAGAKAGSQSARLTGPGKKGLPAPH